MQQSHAKARARRALHFVVLLALACPCQLAVNVLMGDTPDDIFGAVYVLNPVSAGGVFAERRARMMDKLLFLSRSLPVHFMGVSSQLVYVCVQEIVFTLSGSMHFCSIKG